MEKLKSCVEISKYIDEEVYDGIKRKKEFKDCEYEDLLLLYSRVTEINDLERNTDNIGIVTSRREAYIIKNLNTKKMHEVIFSYIATHKTDGYEILSIEEVDREEIDENNEDDSEKKILTIRQFDKDCYIHTYLLKTRKSDTKEIIGYSSYFHWIKEKEEETEEEERNILDEFVNLTLD